MSRFRAALLACLVAAGLAPPASAQIIGRAFEISGQGGAAFFDLRSDFKNAALAAGSLSWRYSPMVALEASGLVSKSEHKPDGGDAWFSTYGADLRLNLRDPSGRVVPFVLGGGVVARSRLFGATQVDDLDRGAATAAIGALFDLMGNDRLYVRVQVSDTWFRDRGETTLSNDLSPTLGLTYVWRGKARDSDSDGVKDWLDKCPDTPLGAKVDANGCPIDSDGDGVYDGLDQCPDTPKGCVVDRNGCPVDSDGDGVCDGLDKCPDTPKGATVDASGCPMDSDGDGVLDGLDKCPDTPKGCVVDANGCPVDSDGDGVCDGLDQCPNTPAGVKVGANGCPVELGVQETQLLDAGVIRVEAFKFDTGKASIKAESDTLLRELGKILIQYPMLKFEVGGFTDNTGSKKKNVELSKARADSVLARLKALTPALPDSQFTTAGYGPDRPVASNATALGRAKNRRIEIRALNPDALPGEREKRHVLKQEAAPSK